MNGIKNFPLVLTTEAHAKLKEIARKQEVSMKQFVFNAIEEKYERIEMEEEERKAEN